MTAMVIPTAPPTPAPQGPSTQSAQTGSSSANGSKIDVSSQGNENISMADGAEADLAGELKARFSNKNFEEALLRLLSGQGLEEMDEETAKLLAASLDASGEQESLSDNPLAKLMALLKEFGLDIDLQAQDIDPEKLKQLAQNILDMDATESSEQDLLQTLSDFLSQVGIVVQNNAKEGSNEKSEPDSEEENARFLQMLQDLAEGGLLSPEEAKALQNMNENQLENLLQKEGDALAWKLKMQNAAEGMLNKADLHALKDAAKELLQQAEKDPDFKSRLQTMVAELKQGSEKLTSQDQKDIQEVLKNAQNNKEPASLKDMAMGKEQSMGQREENSTNGEKSSTQKGAEPVVNTEKVGETQTFAALEKNFRLRLESSSLGVKQGQESSASNFKADHPVVRQVNHQVNLMVQGGHTRMIMQLQPEHLGNVEIRLDMHDDKVKLSLKVQDEGVKAILEKNLVALKEHFNEQNLTLEKASVSVNTDSRQAADGQAFGQNQHQNRQARRSGQQGQDMNLVVEEEVDNETGRRLGYNTMEYLA